MKTKFLTLMILATTVATLLTGCDYEYESDMQDIANQQEITQNLVEKQPTPTDINFSLERYNLIRRAY